MLRELHWTAIVFGSATGVVVGYLLFAIGGGLAASPVGEIVVQVFAFLAAGYIAGRFSLTHIAVAGRISALLLFFFITSLTIAAGAVVNPFGLIFLGILALGAGSAGARFAESRRPT